MSQPDGLAVRLLDVKAVRINAAAWGVGDVPPEWATTEADDGSGVLQLIPLNDRVIVQLSAKFTQRRIAVEISLQGLYEVDTESRALLAASDENNRPPVLERMSSDYRALLADRAGRDLYPYLRQAFHTTSIQLDPRAAIKLSPPGQWDILGVAPPG